MTVADIIAIIIILLLISLLVIVIFDFNDQYSFFKKLSFGTRENFTLLDYYPGYCRSCGWKSRAACSNCTNCGYCVTADGRGECVSGDQNGPYFRQDCARYEYNNPINTFPVTSYPSYGYNYPGYLNPYYYNYYNLDDTISDYLDENYNYRYPGSTGRNRPQFRSGRYYRNNGRYNNRNNRR